MNMKTLLKRIFLVVSLVVPSLILYGIGAGVSSLFFVQKDIEIPRLVGYVNDFAGSLDSQTSEKLGTLLSELDAKAKAQLFVTVVDTLNGESIETYANKMFNTWGIGDKKTNRGVLLLVAIKDRKSRIETGYGLEGILPDGLTGAIQDEYMIPSFKKLNYSEASIKARWL